MTTIDDATLLIDQPVAANARLNVRLASAELRITGTATDRITIRTPDGSSVSRLVVEADRDVVSVRDKDTFGVVLGRGRPTAVLEITVPASTEVATEIAGGDTETHGLCGSQRHRSASGDLRLFEAAGSIELNTVSGAGLVELAGGADLTVRTVSGDVAVSGGTLGDLRVSTTSGDVQLESPLTRRTGNAIETLSGDVSIRASRGIRVDARTVSGDLTSDQPHRSEGRMGRRTLVVGDGAIELAFRSVSGDLHVRGGGPGDAVAAAHGPATSREPSEGDADGGSGGDILGAIADDDRMAILRAVERGELDVAAAMAQLAALDGPRAAARAGDEGADGSQAGDEPAEASPTDA